MLRALAALLVLQAAASLGADSPSPAPQFFRYERSVAVPQAASGQVCAALDAAVLAHASKQSLDDVRLYANGTKELPFSLTESGAIRFNDESAELKNVSTRGKDIIFDLRMPNRPYTAVRLNIDAKNFLASAAVSGSNGGAGATALGEFALFDFSGQHLARSTTLALQESTYRDLHVMLHMAPAPAETPHTFPATILRGATVPPSREAQSLYTTVATSSSFVQRGRDSVATLHIPARVPVERFAFELDPAYRKDFLRNVRITARPDNAQDTASAEAIPGQISHTTLPPGSAGYAPDESLTRYAVDAVLGANLRTGAAVDIAVENAGNSPLPLHSVQLQMRERSICFDALPQPASYTLHYGDTALEAPGYAPVARTTSRTPAAAYLGPEETNRNFRPRADARSYSERHPEVIWLSLIAAIAALGLLGRRGARKHH